MDQSFARRLVEHARGEGVGSRGRIGGGSGAQFQPDDPQNATPVAPIDENAPVEKTLKCRECGTMNVATEWYCENCGAELAAL